MGLLKKRPDEGDAAGELEDVAKAADAEVAMPEAAASEAAPAALAPEAAPAEAEPEAPAGDDASDALLSMFHETDTGSGDREILLQMVGEVELPDLVDQLQTVAAALRKSAAHAR